MFWSVIDLDLAAVPDISVYSGYFSSLNVGPFLLFGRADIFGLYHHIKKRRSNYPILKSKTEHLLNAEKFKLFNIWESITS